MDFVSSGCWDRVSLGGEIDFGGGGGVHGC